MKRLLAIAVIAATAQMSAAADVPWKFDKKVEAKGPYTFKEVVTPEVVTKTSPFRFTQDQYRLTEDPVTTPATDVQVAGLPNTLYQAGVQYQVPTPIPVRVAARRGTTNCST